MELDWKQRAEALFYVEKKSVREIADATGISRKSISAHLRSTEGYLKERESRKAMNAQHRQEYKRQWDRAHRGCFSGGPVTAETIRREHDMAAVILSREKYR